MHSVNSRSAMLFGTARKVTDMDKKARHLERFVDGLFPGRWDMLRPITPQELKATTLMFMPIEEASAKIRIGQPPEPDPRNRDSVEMPEHVSAFEFG